MPGPGRQRNIPPLSAGIARPSTQHPNPSDQLPLYPASRLRSISLFGEYTRPPAGATTRGTFRGVVGGSPSSAIRASLFRLGLVPKQLGESLVCAHSALSGVQISGQLLVNVSALSEARFHE